MYMESLEAEVEVVMLLVWSRSDGCEEVVSAREGGGRIRGILEIERKWGISL
ncbi:hypothetical protein QG37_07104 [Candidozyma auris]|nr:hypothetical protein QG37_07104 [[Candida] auris]